MYGTVRGVATLVGAGIAGGLIWLSTQIGQGSTGGYWAAVGILAGAGLTMARLAAGRRLDEVGGAADLGRRLPDRLPAGARGGRLGAARRSARRELVPAPRRLLVRDIAIDGPVHDLRAVLAVLAFGLGLVFGFTFDTSGPRRPGEPIWESYAPEEPAEPAGRPWPTTRRRRP